MFIRPDPNFLIPDPGPESATLALTITVFQVKKMGIEIGTALAEKSKGLFSAEDWQCAKVGYRVWCRYCTLRYRTTLREHKAE
jgi:hypothetical protein